MDGIRVRGVGRVSLQPDLARITVGVDLRRETADEAQHEVSRRMRAIIEALAAHGLPPERSTTQEASLQPIYDYSGEHPRLTGYQAVQTLRVTSTDPGAVGQLIDLVVAAGANQITAIEFALQDQQAPGHRARELAIADARANAETLARAAGVQLGTVIAIVEDDPSVPSPVRFARAEMLAAETPIAPGATDVTIGTTVTFAIAASL